MQLTPVDKEKEINRIMSEIRELWSGGHPDFLGITFDELKLHSEKNTDYSKGGDALGNFHRVAKILSNYPNLKVNDPTVISLIYALKQLDAALWMINQGYEGSVENVETRLRDVHIYMKIARILHKEGK
jgi:hypothetical protein